MNTHGLNYLIGRNKEFKERHRNNLLYRQMSSGHYDTQEKRDQFLNYFQTWSNCFQKAMLLKTAFCEDPYFAHVFSKHYQEELGHNEMLKKDRQKDSFKRDAVLEAVANWFPSKMVSLNQSEHIIIMNLTVEAAALVFYEFAKPAIDPDNKLSHFQAHGEIDICHESLGLDLLEDLNERQYKRLLEIQEDSWEMLDALMHRLGELTV